MMIFFLVLFILPLFTLKKREPNAPILDAASTTCIKGVLCLYVMLHNLGLDYPGNTAWEETVCEHTGGIAVGVFFFLSAFGLVRSYKKKGDHFLARLLYKNVPDIYLTAVFINTLIYLVFFRGQFERRDLWLRILNLDLFNNFARMNRHGWFIATLLVLYIVFAIVYFILRKCKYQMPIGAVILSVVAVGARVLAQICDKGGMYTREITCFAIGILYATFFEKINEIIAKRFWFFLSTSSVLCVVGFIFYEPLASWMATVVIITVSQRCSYQNPVTYFLGQICIGVYLFLYFSTCALSSFVENPYWWVLLNAGFILELSVMLFFIKKVIFRCISFVKEKCHTRQPKTEKA